MKTLETALIANRSTKQLSALGFKQLNRFIEKACQTNNTHRLMPEGRVLSEQVRDLVFSLIFDHNVSKEQLSQLQKSVKIVNNQLQLPSIASL